MRVFSVCVVMLGLLSMPALVWAGEDLDKAEQLTAEMKYGSALKVAAKVLRSADSGPEDLAAAYRIQGMCFAALGQGKKARRAFDRLLSIDPEHQLSKRVSPKLRQPFDAALAAAKEKKPIGLRHEVPALPETLSGLELSVLLDDRLKMVKEIRVSYSLGDGPAEEHVWKVKGAGAYKFQLPEEVDASQLIYHFVGVNRHGGVLAFSGKADEPFKLLSKAGVALAQKVEADKKAAEEKRLADAQALAALETKAELDDDGRKGAAGTWYTTWWFWTGVGVVVAGAATGVAVAASSSGGGGELEYNVVLR